MRTYIPENAKTLPKNAKRVFKGEIFDVYQWPQEMFDGTVTTFEMLMRQDTAEIITLIKPDEQERLVADWRENGVAEMSLPDLTVKETRVIITHQTQPHQKWFYAYPGGRVDEADRDELFAAKRELQEETGIKCRNWKLVEAHQPFAKADWLIYTFLATGLDAVAKQSLDGGEKIEPMLLTFSELKEYAKKPEAKFLWPEWMRGVRNFEELEEVAEVFKY